jgi:hypothetical protein
VKDLASIRCSGSPPLASGALSDGIGRGSGVHDNNPAWIKDPRRVPDPRLDGSGLFDCRVRDGRGRDATEGDF